MNQLPSAACSEGGGLAPTAPLSERPDIRTTNDEFVEVIGLAVFDPLLDNTTILHASSRVALSFFGKAVIRSVEFSVGNDLAIAGHDDERAIDVLKMPQAVVQS